MAQALIQRISAIIDAHPITSDTSDTSNSSNTSDTIGGRVGRARESAGFSVAQAARRLGVKTATWQSWESDRAEPRSNRLMIIAGSLGVSPAWLLTGQGKGPNEALEDDVEILRQELHSIVEDFAAAQARLASVLERLDSFHTYNRVEPS